MAKKLSDEEKRTLLSFYKENPVLWDSTNPYSRNKEMKDSLKNKLSELFDNNYSCEQLEKTYHSSRASMLREVKKNAAGSNLPSKQWKFYQDMEFVIPDLTREKKKTSFSSEETDDLIEFYRDNPPLWNHTLQQYRDKHLREALMNKLSQQFEGKFSVEELKTCWHNTLTMYKREKQREEGSRSSGSGLSERYISQWEYFNQMEFVDITCEMDETINTIDDDEPRVQPPTKKKRGQSEEQSAKTELWKALAHSITHNPNNQSHIQQQQVQEPSFSGTQSSLEQRAHLFGRLVADNLLQCDTRDWTFLKKKVMDMFFEYEQQKEVSTSMSHAYQLQPGSRPERFTAMLRSTSPAESQSFPTSMSFPQRTDSFGQ